MKAYPVSFYSPVKVQLLVFVDPVVQLVKRLAHVGQIGFEMHGRNLFQMAPVCNGPPATGALPMLVRAAVLSVILASVSFEIANPVLCLKVCYFPKLRQFATSIF